jgi:hypothetical protein
MHSDELWNYPFVPHSAAIIFQNCVYSKEALNLSRGTRTLSICDKGALLLAADVLQLEAEFGESGTEGWVAKQR